MGEELGIDAVVSLDMSQFSGSISKINEGLSLAQAKFKEASSSLGAFGSDSDKLSVKSASLTEKIDLQKQKVAILQEAYTKASSETGKNSDQTNIAVKSLLNAQSALNKMNSDLSKTSVELETQPSKWGKLSNSMSEIDKRVPSLSNGFSNLKSTIMGFAAVAIAGFSLKSVVDEMNSEEKAAAQMGAVLKSTGDASGMTSKQLTDLADAQSKVTTNSKDTTVQAENMLLTFTNIKSNVFPQTIKTAEDMATALGTNASEAAKTLGKAMNDPATGLSKLTRLGVTFTAAQKEQITAMEKAGNVAGAQGIILDTLSQKFGGSAKAAGSTVAGQIQIMTNGIKESGATILTSLMPIVTSTMPMLTKAIQDISSVITAHKSEIVGAVSTVVAVVKDIFNFVTTHGPLIKGLIIGIGSAFIAFKVIGGIISGITTAINIWQGVTKAFTIVQAALNLVMSMNPIALIVIGIAVLVAAFVILWVKCAAFRDFWIDVWEGIQTAFFAVVNFIKDNWKQLALFLVDPIAGIIALLYNICPQFRAWANSVGTNIKNGFTSAIDWIKALPANMLQWGSDMIANLVKGITNGIGAVGNAVKGIADKITSFLHFSVPDEGPLVDSPSWMDDFMQNTIAGGITNNIPKIKAAMQGLTSNMQINASASGGGSSGSTTNNTYNQPAAGDTVFNFDMGGGQIKTVRLTSEQLAHAQRQRTGFKAVVA